METNKSIEHVLENMDKSIVYKTRNSPLRALLFVAIGIASLVTHSTFVWGANSIISPLLMVAGWVSITVAIIMISFRKSHYVAAANHQRLKQREIYFQPTERNKLLQLLENGSLKEINSLKPAISDGLKLRILTTNDGELCFAQVIAFEANEHTNISPAKHFSLPQSLYLTRYSGSNNANKAII